MKHYTQETRLLDYNHQEIQKLIDNRGWKKQPPEQAAKLIYEYVRDEVLFGYNVNDKLRASKIYRDGYGQCNTKGILFMALLRSIGIPSRFHGFAIDKKLQKGAIDGLMYKLSPREIIHSWVEVYIGEQWINIEGFILDKTYLHKLQRKFSEIKGDFCGYGVATDNFADPLVEWTGNDTYIQKEGIIIDYGIFDDPDAFFASHSQQLSLVKRFIFRHFARYIMNRNVSNIRDK